MNNPAYTWIKSVNADSPINKAKSDKIRKCRLSLFFSFQTQKTAFSALWPSFVSVGLRVCLVLPHMMPAKTAHRPKRGGL